MLKKSELPRKTCPVCERPFAWRAKWKKNWDEVVYCSERCRRQRRRNSPRRHQGIGSPSQA